jgi:hypothetical protein
MPPVHTPLFIIFISNLPGGPFRRQPDQYTCVKAICPPQIKKYACSVLQLKRKRSQHVS